jgi:polar amino acid transport system permease protein
MGDFVTFILKLAPEFIQGTKITLLLTFGTLLIGLVIGLPASLIRVYGAPWLRSIIVGYIALFRGTPLLVQLFIVYYGLPDIGIIFSRFVAALLTLGLNSGAYQAEYFRGALQAVGQGQMTAARAIGMNKFKAIRFIVLPQALRLVLPAWSNEIVSILKYTAVVFLIAVPDLMSQAKVLSSRYFDPIPIYLSVAFIYFILVVIANYLLRILMRKLETPGLEMDVNRR